MNHQKGSTLIEILIASTVLALVLTGFLSALAALGISELKSRHKTEASLLAKESIEIAYNLSISDWNAFYNYRDNHYHPSLYCPPTKAGCDLESEGYYNFELGTEFIKDKYSRLLNIQSVYRNNLGDMSLTPKPNYSLDPNSLMLKSQVSWKDTSTEDKIVYEMIITNLSAIAK